VGGCLGWSNLRSFYHTYPRRQHISCLVWQKYFDACLVPAVPALHASRCAEANVESCDASPTWRLTCMRWLSELDAWAERSTQTEHVGVTRAS
jgi:hypothetical protein